MGVPELSKEQWIQEVKRQLIFSELSAAVMDNYQRWAETLAETYFADGYNPQDTVSEELSNA